MGTAERGHAAQPASGSGAMPSRANSRWSRLAVGIARGQQLLAVEDRVRAGEEAQRLQLIAESRAPADRRTCERGIKMRATAIVRTNSNGSSGAAAGRGVPGIGTRSLIGTLSGCGSSVASVGAARRDRRESRPFRGCPRSTP